MTTHASPQPSRLQLHGRSSSHFTRVPRIFAHALNVPLELVPIFDITNVDSAIYAGNPALKVPTLRREDGSLVFGAENISRALAELSSSPMRIVWPEQLRSDLSRNAQELVWHAMAAQMQLVMGTVMCKLPVDNTYFVKGRAGLEGALRWLDAHVDAALRALPEGRDLSLFEVTLHCLVEHLRFRPTVDIGAYPALTRFAAAFASTPAAQATVYAFDTPP